MKPRYLYFVLTLVLFPAHAFAQSAPLDRIEILGRLGTAGSSPSAVAKLVKTRGISFAVTEGLLTQVKLAGGDGILVKRLEEADGSGNPHPITDTAPSLERMSKCAELIHAGAVEAAELECRAAIEENPRSPWPLLAAAEAIAVSAGLPAGSENDAKQNEAKTLAERAMALSPSLKTEMQSSAEDQLILTSNLEGRPLLDFKSLLSSKLGAFGLEYDASREHDTGENAEDSLHPVDASPNIFEKEVQQEPDLAANHIRLSYLHAQARHLAEAVSEFEAAIQLEPDNPDLHLCLAALHFSHERDEAALADLHESVRIAPSAANPRIALAAALDMMGRAPEATAELRSLIANRPLALDASNALVELYLEHDDRASAI